MEINADHSQRIVVNHHELAWISSPESGVERRMLERQGDEVAKATSIVRYQQPVNPGHVHRQQQHLKNDDHTTNPNIIHTLYSSLNYVLYTNKYYKHPKLNIINMKNM